MNIDLIEALKIYCTGKHDEMHKFLLEKSKDNLIAIITDLLTMYVNDKNSSTIREYITVTIAGFMHHKQKLGYNGYKQTTEIGGEPIQCEAKPKNFNTEEIERFKNGERKTAPSKLNGNGNFTDYCHRRLKKDIEGNPFMLVSGFVDGRLVYILQFPFVCNAFVNNLKRQVENRFPKGDIPGEYLRSANFDYTNYIGCSELKIIFLLGRKNLSNYKGYISPTFYNYLISKAKDE
jgi:hypothetical protein